MDGSVYRVKIDIPELSLVALIGAGISEKSDFSKQYFSSEEVLAFDDFRRITADDKEEEATEEDGASTLYDAVEKRLKAAQFTAVYADNMGIKERQILVGLAKKHHCFPVAIVFNTLDVKEVADKSHTVRSEDSIKVLEKEGFRYIYLLNSQEEASKAEVIRTKLYNNKRDIHGPFDIIGDIHGCYDELCELLEKLGYKVDRQKYQVNPPKGRIAAFVGDLIDRGPKSMAVLRLVMSMVKEGKAYCVLGNHDGKLQRKLKGSNVQVAHGLETTLEEMKQEPEAFVKELKTFLDGRISHYVFDEGRLVVAHAGLKEKLQGRGSRKIRNLSMFGETTGQVDEFGLPIRRVWAKAYQGNAFVVYGHTPTRNVQIINNTANIDTGCVFGGKLTALRYPEKEIVDVAAKAVYYKPARPF